MFTDDYMNFKTHIDSIQVPTIARIMAMRIRPVINDLFGEPELSRIEVISEFFTDVIRRTGGKSSLNSILAYDELITNWKKGRSKSLVVETYYYLHTTMTGRYLAADIDRLIFKGKSFNESIGHPVPGGYAPPETVANKSINQEILDVVRRVEASQADGIVKASFDLLSSIAREYDSSHTLTDLEILKSYLSAKIVEWREQRVILIEAETVNQEDQKLLIAASTARDSGDFERADALIAQSSERFYEEERRATLILCDRFTLRAKLASLSGNQIKEAQFYDTASDMIAHLDKVKSIYFAHYAANAAYRRSFDFADVPLRSVFIRFHKIIVDMGNEDSLINKASFGWKDLGPLFSLCDIMSKLADNEENPLYFDSAEEVCRGLLEDEDQFEDPIIPAFLRSMLGRILHSNAFHPEYRKRIKQSLRFHSLALKVINYSIAPEIWHTVKMQQGITLMNRDDIKSGVRYKKLAIASFQNLIDVCDKKIYVESCARARHNIGACLLAIGKKEENVHLMEDAIAMLEVALDDRRFDSAPVMFARTRSLMGDCYMAVFDINQNPNYLEYAIYSYTDSIEIWQKISDNARKLSDEDKMQRAMNARDGS